jgi:cytochrome c553
MHTPKLSQQKWYIRPMLQDWCVRLLVGATLLWANSLHAQTPSIFEDSMAQRLQACTACHGAQGRAGPDGYYPRLAGKPAGYLYNQLRNFQTGHRQYGLMVNLLEPLSDAYLRDIAEHFATMKVPYPAALPATGTPAQRERGQALARLGDESRKIPACTSCHGEALMGVQPAVPGLLGLPKDYLNAQLGAWRSGERRAHAPDCMADVAKRLSSADIAAVVSWLAAQPVPSNSAPAANLPRPIPLQCGSVPAATSPRVSPAASVPVPVSIAPTANTPTARGQYLSLAGNCQHCHTAPGGAPYAGGRRIDTPFGAVYSSNLTPDAATGIGPWSADDFWQAMHHGRSHDGRKLSPAFPYTNFTHITRADSDALFAWLQTLPAVNQTNKTHALRWPYGTSLALNSWRTLYFTEGNYTPDRGRSAQWNRGAYLVESLGHCSACHASRNALGGNRNARALDGGKVPPHNWLAPSLLNPDEAGVQNWSENDVVQFLRSGYSPRGVAQGPMAQVVQHSTQYLHDDDLRAMAHYLQSLPIAAAPVQAAPAQAPATPQQPTQGAALYRTHCSQCHGPQGQGVPNAYPALAGSRMVTMTAPGNLVRTVLQGGFAPSTVSNPRPFGMPPFALQLNDGDMAAVLNYIRNSWGNHAPALDAGDVDRLRNSAR